MNVDFVDESDDLGVIHEPRLHQSLLAELKHELDLLREEQHGPALEHKSLKTIIDDQDDRVLCFPVLSVRGVAILCLAERG